nr:Chain C, GLU-ASP-GLN-GLU-THR-ALA-VAL [Homo sapiens]5ELQ_P Chain P, GLU-ASP-GLN-GLU-THR-ALA-VAL [Homo sapiens]
REDQETAV